MMDNIKDILTFHEDNNLFEKKYSSEIFYKYLYYSRPKFENEIVDKTNLNKIVNLYGVAGNGKTTIVDYLISAKKFQFKNVLKLNMELFQELDNGTFKFEDIVKEQLNHNNFRINKDKLLIFDNLDIFSNKPKSNFWNYITESYNTNLLILSRFKLNSEIKIEHINLSNVTQVQINSIIEKRLGLISNLNEINSQYEILKNIDLNKIANSTNGSIRSVLWQILDFVLVSNNNPFKEINNEIEIINPHQFITHAKEVIVKDINEEIFQFCKKDPNFIYHLPSRKFEELIADIFSNQGFEATLTPAIKDGGFDIFLSKSEKFGDLLYVVECKRFTPPNKVGVDVIRSLYGVVERNNFNAGIVVTSSFFTKDAKVEEKVLNHKMHLNDYNNIKDWLRDYKNC